MKEWWRNEGWGEIEGDRVEMDTKERRRAGKERRKRTEGGRERARGERRERRRERQRARERGGREFSHVYRFTFYGRQVDERYGKTRRAA